MLKPRLTQPLLEAIESALNSALAGEGFHGGDFDGQNPEHFQRALEWVQAKLERQLWCREWLPTDPEHETTSVIPHPGRESDKVGQRTRSAARTPGASFSNLMKRPNVGVLLISSLLLLTVIAGCIRSKTTKLGRSWWIEFPTNK